MTESGASVELLLFIAGRSQTMRDAEALANQLAQSNSPPAELTVIDLREEPTAAIDYDVLAIPALLRNAPPPQLQVVGEFPDVARLRSSLGLAEL